MSVTPKRPECPIREHKCLLCGLFGFVDASQHPVAGPEDLSRLALDQNLERAHIARHQGARQRDVVLRER
jgi:hypothetical protein